MSWIEVISCKFSFRWYMGVGGGEVCPEMQIHPRIPYLEPTYCAVQLEAFESLFLSTHAHSASAPPRAAYPCPCLFQMEWLHFS